ncbi:hypothetical protein GCM10011386_13600 [Parapedobacter defluvii]|uniref:Uncharacterized protein n=1 Tax=Parapedobacter defluvii TaxID=2045106 RepID=A0ABQ1LCM1_9SPHI|nr:hypothetical protein [Parapedobacter defluvii]GGC23003.1 hypothetical protein GCM10011386_13600 [Parapedobacter defluvii]
MGYQNIQLDFKAAVDVPRWAFRFYLHHFLWIAGLSVIPSIERFIVLFFSPDWSNTTVILLEVLVESLRFLVLWFIIKLSILRDERLRKISGQEQWVRIKSFVKHRWLSLVFQLIFMIIATLVFDVFLEKVVGSQISEQVRDQYLGVLLAIKNPTVIAWFLIWLVGIPRQMMLYPPAASSNHQYVSV